jgi:hypothetical protein
LLRVDEFRLAHPICRGSAERAKKLFLSKFSGSQLHGGGPAASSPPRATSFGVLVPAVGGQGGVQERRVWSENLCLGCGHVRVLLIVGPPSPPLAGVALVAQGSMHDVCIGLWLCLWGSGQGRFGLSEFIFVVKLGARVQVIVGDRSWRVATGGGGIVCKLIVLRL